MAKTNRNQQKQWIKLTAPYQFAALNQEVYFPEWASQVSQDIPFSDGIDGIIEVTLKNVSPLFTRDGEAQNQDEKSRPTLSAHIFEDGQRRYLIPATTLKGMLRSTMEIMSFAKMQMFDDRYFAYRSFNQGEELYDTYHKAMGAKSEGSYDEKVFGCGWLSMDEEENLSITPCEGPFERIPHSEMAKKPLGKTSYQRNESVGWYPLITRNGKSYYLVCTGDINKKEKEYLFPTAVSKQEPLTVTDEVRQKFMDVHDGPSPDFDKYLYRLKRKERVAVFFAKDKDGNVKVIGLSRMIRYPYENGVKKLIEVQQKTNGNDNGRDLCETIWGYADGKESLKGRVQIGHAFCSAPIADSRLVLTRGILGQPKASFYPLYLKQSDATDNKFKTYNTATGIAGRKLYKIHTGATTTELPQGNGNGNTTTTFHAIPADCKFKFRIRVHNLRPIEVGALLSALTLNNTPGTFHNIGMAKAYGFGKIQIISVNLVEGFEKTAEDYMHDFEREMSRFCGREWVKTEPIRNLASILSEHTDEEVRPLQLKGGNDGKTDEFRIVKRQWQEMADKDKGTGMHSFLTQEERDAIHEEAERRKYEAKDREAKAAEDNEQYEEAIRIYEDIQRMLSIQGVDTTREETRIAELQEKIAKREERESAEKAELERKAKEAKMAAGLAAVLEETYEQGPKKDQPKITDMKVCLKKTEKWLKDAQRTQLSEQERNDFIATLCRLRENPAKKELRDWKEFDKGSIWPSVRKLTGDEAARKLFEH